MTLDDITLAVHSHTRAHLVGVSIRPMPGMVVVDLLTPRAHKATFALSNEVIADANYPEDIIGLHTDEALRSLGYGRG